MAIRKVNWLQTRSKCLKALDILVYIKQLEAWHIVALFCTWFSANIQLLGLLPWERGTAESQVPALCSTVCFWAVWTSLAYFSRAAETPQDFRLACSPMDVLSFGKCLFPPSLLSLLPLFRRSPWDHMPPSTVSWMGISVSVTVSVQWGMCMSCACLQLKESGIPISLGIVCASQ